MSSSGEFKISGLSPLHPHTHPSRDTTEGKIPKYIQKAQSVAGRASLVQSTKATSVIKTN